jgi:hypothetical protein
MTTKSHSSRISTPFPVLTRAVGMIEFSEHDVEALIDTARDPDLLG